MEQKTNCEKHLGTEVHTATLDERKIVRALHVIGEVESMLYDFTLTPDSDKEKILLKLQQRVDEMSGLLISLGKEAAQ